MLIQDERQPQPQDELQDRGDGGVEQGIEYRQPEDGVAPEPLVILETDENTGATDGGVGEAQPDAEPERIGQEAQKKDRCRQHEEQAEPVPAFGQARQDWRSRTRGYSPAVLDGCGHPCRSPSLSVGYFSAAR